jgi:hypothetical protein
MGVGFLFFQYSITPTLHKCIEQSRFMESHLPGGKPKTDPEGLGSLLPDGIGVIVGFGKIESIAKSYSN